MATDSDTRSDSPLQYWHEGASILRECLNKAERGDMLDAPMPLTGAQAALWHQAQASAYRHALEMMGPPEGLGCAIEYDDSAIDAVQRLLERGKAYVDSDGYLCALVGETRHG